MTSKRQDEFYSYLLMKVDYISQSTGVEPLIVDKEHSITWVFETPERTASGAPEASHIIKHQKGAGGVVCSALKGKIVRSRTYKHLSGLERHAWAPLRVESALKG